MFGQIGRRSSGRWADWTPVGMALAVAAVTALVTHHLRPSKQPFPTETVAWAVIVVGCVFMVSATACLVTFRILRPRTSAEPWATATAFAAAGVWFSPLILTAFDGAIWLAVVTVVLGATLARLLAQYRHSLVGLESDDDEAWIQQYSRDMFAGLSAAKKSPWKQEALGAAILLQAGVASILFGIPTLGILCIALSGLLVGWSSRRSIDGLQTKIFSRGSSVVSTVGAIAVLCIIGIFGEPPLYPGMPNDGGGQGRQGEALADTNMFSSIILKSATSEDAVLLPPPPLRKRSEFTGGSRKPLTFAFTGEYWFFPWLTRGPFKDALERRGSPLSWVFTQEDRHPLTMLAKQRMTSPIPLSCCGRLDVAFQVLPTEVETVSVEVFLSHKPEKELTQRLSLGVAHFATSPSTRSQTEAGRLSETLYFDFPEQHEMAVFTEIEVLFHLHSPRVYRSAKVELEHFTLQPKP